MMNRFEPPAFLRDVVTRWDVLAFVVVIGLVVFLGETSRGLFAPIPGICRNMPRARPSVCLRPSRCRCSSP